MKTRVLVLGGSGMLGHKMAQVLGARFDCYVTLRESLKELGSLWPFVPEKTVEFVDVFNFDSVANAIRRVEPQVVVNCVGIVKQIADAKEAITSITINALLPHRLAALCQEKGIRLIQISTDCVFSGKKGNYTEEDFPDAEDLYGRSKLLGEVVAPHLTLRTSIIGHELRRHTSLVDWFFSQEGKKVKGYTQAIYSGFPTIIFSEIIATLIEKQPKLEGLYHVSSDPIDKQTLLQKLKEAFHLRVDIEPTSDYKCDRSLNSSRFRRAFAYSPPSWNDMIAAMAKDERHYKK